MSAVDLTDQEWGQVMSILSDAPWKFANPLLMKIGEQLRAQYAPPGQQNAQAQGIKLDANGREIPQ